MIQHKNTLPVIGIAVGLDERVKFKDSKSTHYVRRTYTQVLKEVGAVPLLINLDMPIGAILSLCDGIVISGGEDIQPDMYGEQKLVVPGKIEEPRERSEWERQLIAACDEVGMPILGICYGMQLLNIHYGGSLYQDIPLELPDSISHELTHHDVEFTNDFLGYSRGDVRDVESRHHQAIHDIAPGFEVCAVAPDGVVEAFKNDRHFGMQWHPESDLTGVHVYRSFVEHCMPGLSYGLHADSSQLVVE